jgi:hypothetical protein
VLRLRAAGLRAVEREAVVPDFLAAGRFAAAGFEAPALRGADVVFALLAVERLAAGLRRAAALRAGLRAAVERVAEPVEEALALLRPPLLVLADPSIDHLPDSTFCAASATASAISEPSLVALDMTDLAALSAVSAASIPASLMALRAFGLALIAAAAAASPAASISLLIAALAILPVVDFEELEREDFELVLRLLAFAIANLRLDSPI